MVLHSKDGGIKSGKGIYSMPTPADGSCENVDVSGTNKARIDVDVMPHQLDNSVERAITFTPLVSRHSEGRAEVREHESALGVAGNCGRQKVGQSKRKRLNLNKPPPQFSGPHSPFNIL